jgi:hypothetical protein
LGAICIFMPWWSPLARRRIAPDDFDQSQSYTDLSKKTLNDLRAELQDKASIRNNLIT